VRSLLPCFLAAATGAACQSGSGDCGPGTLTATLQIPGINLVTVTSSCFSVVPSGSGVQEALVANKEVAVWDGSQNDVALQGLAFYFSSSCTFAPGQAIDLTDSCLFVTDLTEADEFAAFVGSAARVDAPDRRR
jgi:hypothetical protein